MSYPYFDTSQQDIFPIGCPFCGSKRLVFDPTKEAMVCASCGASYLQRPYIPPPESVSVTSANAGTVTPVAVETEEFGFRKKTTEIFPHTHPEFEKIESELQELKESVEELKKAYPKVVVIEEVPKEEAKQRIEGYFKEHGKADIEELMLNLKIPVQTIVETIDELKREGKLSAEEE